MPAHTDSLPAEISNLMTNTIQWFQFTGFNSYAEPQYADFVELNCWIEPHAGSIDGGLTPHRNADNITVTEAIVDVYFDGADPLAQQIKLWDHFLPPGVGIDPTMLQVVKSIETMYGPPFDNVDPWLIIVSL